MIKFEFEPDGNIKVCPLTGFATATAAGMACLLRIEYAKANRDLDTKCPSSLQLALTPAQAVELSQDLMRAGSLLIHQRQTGVPQ